MARIPYDFTPFPRKLHPGWAGRSHASWGLCVRLWLLADGQPIQVHGADWRASLCQQMGIGGRDRPTTRALMADLQSDGLMTAREGFVHVKFHPDERRPGTTELRTELVAEESARGSTGVQPGVGQGSDPLDLSDRNHSDRFLQTDRQTDKTERETASEPPVDRSAIVRRLELRGEGLTTWILNEHARRYYALNVRPPAGLKRKEMAQELATWVEGASGAYCVSNQVLASKVLDGLFASEKAAGGKHSLSWAVQCPEEYCGLPNGEEYEATRRTTTKEQAEADKRAAVAAKLLEVRRSYAEQIKAARDVDDDYTANRLAAERDERLARLSAQAS